MHFPFDAQEKKFISIFTELMFFDNLNRARALEKLLKKYNFVFISFINKKLGGILYIPVRSLMCILKSFLQM